ncbi:MAG TPA: T9SS type A sorting domain-containing protein [Bacteroidales bacterium]|nr:T9SS type A sorting domain-containing protein [Bacteroidales bacterium]
MDLASAFPLFYRFNENHRGAGWVTYTTGTNVLNPLAGYAGNFGTVAIPKTVDVMGEVNNGSFSVTLFNHDSTFTKGFNLVGNPYPSPVNWDAAGWTKINIDTAVYYFKASATDEYGGTYSSYIKGISSDGFATNIIPSMQGFFVHVSDGTFPVTGTLGVSNSVRINDLTHPFLKSANSDDRFLLRATATFADDIASADPAVIYFDDGAQQSFDGGFDALKLMNTDMLVTNFYSVLTGDKKLSVNALPTELFDTTLTVPLGLMIYRDGEVIFKIKDLENRPGEINIYFRDAVTGSNINMLTAQDYRVVLNAGDYNNRFSLAFLKNATGIGDHPTSDRIFSAYESSGKVKATVNTISGGEGVITIYDMTGRPLYIKKVYETGYYEFDPGVRQGIYIIGFITGNQRCTLKLILGF